MDSYRNFTNYNNKKYNWENKEERAKKATDHTKVVAGFYPKEIRESIAGTRVFSPDTVFTPHREKYMPKVPEFTLRTQNTPEIIVNNLDSVSSILEFHPGKSCVLNFASYKEPGGMFLQGSRAQEECLCHESFLYNVLQTQTKYYEENKKHLNKALYQNRALYTPNVVFFRGDDAVWCDVITCAAPNFTTAKKYNNVTREENSTVLESRIEFILEIAETMQVDTLILGAFGSGVFGQDAEEVAEIFKRKLKENHYGFRRVVFSIIQNGDGNYEKFVKVFEK